MNKISYAPGAYADLTSTCLRSKTTSGEWLLEDRREAFVALSCLIEPECGDVVLVADTTHGCFITHILKRANKNNLAIGAFDQELTVKSRSLRLNAVDRIKLGAVNDCEITALKGKLDIKANEMRTTIVGALIQRAGNHIANFGDWLVSVKGFYRLHAERQHLTSEAEMKIDAEIIHMG